uniref:Zinc metalloproteinase n=1 Tax=Caenorhabditis japonica TaxID=281687 RepID=A0A8R1DT52_CAEJA
MYFQITFLLLLLPLFHIAASSLLLDDEDSGVQIEHGRAKRQMMKSGAKWKNGVVNYYFDETNKPDRVKTMLSAMDYIASQTCIEFKNDSAAAQRLKINGAVRTGCSSDVGAPGTLVSQTGTAVLHFENCPTMGSAVHELSHSLGSFHEHNRPDRDQYLDVDMAEVKRIGAQRNMGTQPAGMVLTYVPFEYGSCMMYDTMKYKTRLMKPKQPEYERTMGNRRVGFYDIEKINKYYNCKCEKELKCDNGGYTNPANCSKCVCPKGYFGDLCNQRPRQNYHELAAATYFQQKTIEFKYNFTGDNFNYYTSTFVYINAPNNTPVQIMLREMNGIVCENGCNQNGIEIKTRSDIKSVSPIVCCKDQEFSKQIFTSKNNPTIIELYSSVANNATVTFLYRLMPFE